MPSPAPSAAPIASIARLFRPDERIALFIDGANVHGATRALGVDLDWRRLLEAFKASARFVRASYYTALIDDQDFSPIRPLVDWLDYNGFKVVTKPARDYVDATGRRRWKGNMDVDIAVDIMEAAAHLDHVVLFSGDGDFVSLVEAVQRRGLRVTVLSTIRTSPPMAADELRRVADAFVDLADLAEHVGRAPRGEQA
ncbi:MAG: NYN domain-containing protein [Caulobacterales bacterium]|jgi:uncharacterized LabA/DUF88 family protein